MIFPYRYKLCGKTFYRLFMQQFHKPINIMSSSTAIELNWHSNWNISISKLENRNDYIWIWNQLIEAMNSIFIAEISVICHSVIVNSWILWGLYNAIEDNLVFAARWYHYNNNTQNFGTTISLHYFRWCNISICPQAASLRFDEK